MGLFFPSLLLYSNALSEMNFEKEFTIFNVKFMEDTAQHYGFDNYTAPNTPWKSMQLLSSTDTVMVMINPTLNDGEIYFKSSAPSKVTTAPDKASSSQTLTVKGISKGISNIQANAGSLDGPNITTMGVSVYDMVIKTVAVILVHEENDDVQVTDQGKTGNVCVEQGPNKKKDTVPSGDDEYTWFGLGDDITSGKDGICDTKANNTNLLSTGLDESALKNYLNKKVYNQAVIYWITDRLQDCTINFDLDLDGMIEIGGVISWMSDEMKVIRDNCKDDSYDHNVFLVNNPTRSIYGIMDFNQRYGYVHVDQHIGSQQTENNTAAHELGHGIGMHHPDNDPQSGQPANAATDLENLMHSTATNPWRLRKWQWDRINP